MPTSISGAVAGEQLLYLSSNLVLLVFIFFRFLLPLPPLPFEMPSYQSLSTPRGEFILEQPSTSSSCCELSPSFIAMVQNRPFSGVISNDPHVHVEEFEGLCSGLLVLGMTQETLRWKLFPFSLVDRADQWYTLTVGSVNNWEELRDNFCYSFSHPEHINSTV